MKVKEFLDYQKVNGIKESTLKDQKSKLEIADRWKPLINWKKEDVTRYILKMKDERYAESYIEMNKSLLKQFFSWLGKPKLIQDIKVKLPKRKLKSTEILTPDDIDKLIETANTNRDKALIAFLFESGARISEIRAVKVKDLQETEAGLKAFLPATKTGEDYRPCLCVYSSQYIRNHILYPTLKPNDKLFDLSRAHAWRIIKKIAKDSGIDKPISPHKLRHAQATYMVRKGYQESIIRAKLGWADDSRMIARYQHIDGEDVINATLEREGNGLPTIPKELVKPIKIAAPIAIADPSLQLNQIMTENEDLRAQLNFMERALKDKGII